MPHPADHLQPSRLLVSSNDVNVNDCSNPFLSIVPSHSSSLSRSLFLFYADWQLSESKWGMWCFGVGCFWGGGGGSLGSICYCSVLEARELLESWSGSPHSSRGLRSHQCCRRESHLSHTQTHTERECSCSESERCHLQRQRWQRRWIGQARWFMMTGSYDWQLQ